MTLNSQPKLVVNGRYEILSVLGQGGMGQVVEVKDQHRPEAVMAMKFVLPEAPAIATQMLSREFDILADLEHPGLPRIHGFDFVREIKGSSEAFPALKVGQPLLIREMVPGEPLLQWAKGATEGQILAVMIQLTKTLAYVHDQALIYRDLKPDNILVYMSEGAQTLPIAKLLDFGLALDASEQDARSGTAQYLAPEVLMGEAATAAADLYALGLVFYELLVGQHPFEQLEDTVELVRAQLTQEIANLPPRLSIYQATVSSLLNKQAVDRPQSAWEVWKALVSLERSDGAEDEGPELIQPVANSARMVGRHTELKRLGDCIAALGENTVLPGPSGPGRGRCEILTGPPGSGKSRFFRRLRSQVEIGGLRFLGAARESDGESGSRTALWRHLFLNLLADRRSKKLTPYLPLLKGASLSSTAEWHGGLSPKVARERLHDAGLALLAEEAKAQPFVVLFEDLQSLDLESLDWFERITKAIPDGILLLATSWPPGPTAPGIERVQERLEDKANWIQLEGLSPEQVSTFVYRLTGEKAGEELAKRLYSHTDGNPLFLEELLRGAKSVGHLSQLMEADGVPKAIGEATRLQLGRLSHDVVDCLSALAIIGVPSTIGNLSKVLDSEPSEVEAFLNEASTARLVRRVNQSYWFSHSVLARIAGELPKDQRLRLFHRNASELLLNHSDQPALLKRKALHLIGAGEKSKARALAYRAAELAEGLYASALAVELYRIVLSTIDAEDAEHSLAHWQCTARLARISMWGGNYDRVEHALGALLARPVPDGLDWHGDESPARLWALMGQVATRSSEFDVAIGHFEAALNLARTELTAAEILDHMAEVQLRLGRVQACQSACEQALQRLGEQPAPGLRGSIAYHLGRCFQERTEFAGALEHFETSKAFYDGAGDVRGMASVLGAVATVYEVQNQGEDAVRAHEHSLELMEKAGDVEGVATTLQRLGLCHYMQGDAKEAALHLERSVELYRQLRNSQGVGRVLNALGVLHHIRGAYRDAIDCRSEAMEHQMRLGDVAGLAMSRASLAILYQEIGALDKAEDLVKLALQVTEQLGQRFRHARCQHILGSLYRLTNQQTQSEQLLTEASKLFSEVNSAEALSTVKASLAESALRFGNHAVAKQYADEAAELARSLGQPVVLQAQVVRARVYLADPSSDNALVAEALTEARHIATKLNYADFLWQVFELLGRLALRRLRPMEACRWLSKAMDVVFACYEQLPEDLQPIYVEDPRRQIVRSAFEVALRQASRSGRRRGGRTPALN